MEAGIQCLGEKGGELTADDGGEDLSGKRPVLNHHGVAEATIGNGIGGILLPLAALIPNGGNDHALGSVDAPQVNGGKVGGYWSDPLCDSGEGLRERFL